MPTINIAHLGRRVHRAALLVELYNRSSPRGMGHFQASGAPAFTLASAEAELEQRGGRFQFDYLRGRPIKVFERNGELDSDDARLFDRDNGAGAFDAAVAAALEAMP